jgi:lysophospholipase L1-like esterase
MVGRASVLRKLLRRAALALVGLAVALVALEFGLRAAGWGRKASRYLDPDVGVRFYGNQRHDAFGRDGPLVSFSVNQEGLRGPWYEGSGPPDVLRVLCLGDSFTFGWGVEDDQAYPWQLQGLLEAELGSGKAQVANFGSPIFNTVSERAIYAKLARGKRWDAMFLGWYPNDIQPASYDMRFTDHWVFHALAGTALLEFFHYRVREHIPWFEVERSSQDIERVLLYQENFARIEADPDDELGRSFWEAGMTQLRGLIADVRGDGTRAAVILFPTNPQVTALREALARSGAEGEALLAGPLAAPQRRVRAELAAMDVPVIDLLRPLAECPQDPFGEVDNGHLNALGYRITAEHALGVLERFGLLR